MKALILSALIGATALTSTVAMADDDYMERQAQSTAKLSYDQARATALKAVGGGTVTDIDFDVERGRSIYEVEVYHNNLEYELKIDANTGAIIRKKVDY